MNFTVAGGIDSSLELTVEQSNIGDGHVAVMIMDRDFPDRALAVELSREDAARIASAIQAKGGQS